MKLYAVCVLASPEIKGVMYGERLMPISKVAHLPVNQRGFFAYAPAVYTNKKHADKMLKIMTGKYPQHLYILSEFDSNAVEIPNG